MAKIAVMFLFMMVVNTLFFLTQAATLDINPDGTGRTWYTYSNSTLAHYDAGSGTYVLENNPSARLPSNPITTEATGNVFTDTFNAIKGWIIEKVEYLTDLATGVPNFLKSIGLPQELSFALGALWYAFSVFVTVAFIRGSDL